MLIAVVIALSGTTQDSGAVAAMPADLTAAPEKCSARKAVKFYAGRIAYWRHKMGAGRSGTQLETAAAHRRRMSNPRIPCPRYLAHVLQRKAYGLRKEHHRWATIKRALYLRQRAREALHPKWIALRLLGGDRVQWRCLMSIVWVENRTMDPTLDYGSGHGNVNEAYGIPQASPGTKMASAGPDWRTNPETQLRWMIDYCRDRYGSVCGAAYSRRVHGTY